MTEYYKTLKHIIEVNVCKITLNRPDQRNSLNLEMVQELNDALEECSENNDIKAIVISGEGDAFCSGGDLKTMRDSGDISYFLDKISKSFLQLLFKIRNLKKPVIAAVNGSAMGAGFGLVLACDIRIGVKDAKMSTGFINIGGSPAAGTTYFLPRMVGFAKTMELILLGDTFTAQEAKRMGIVNKIVENVEELNQESMKLAKRLSEGPSAAIAKAKMLLNQSLDTALVQQLEAETLNLVLSGKTEDLKEGLDAFIEKRKTEFKGR